jgi:hypothetical protein
MNPPEPSVSDPNRPRRPAVERRAPPVLVSLGVAALPVAVVGLLSDPAAAVTAAAVSLVVTTTVHTVADGR